MRPMSEYAAASVRSCSGFFSTVSRTLIEAHQHPVDDLEPQRGEEHVVPHPHIVLPLLNLEIDGRG
jgi:hypothetical protein